jgi:UDP-glucuronate 4-epimerase
MVKNNYSRVALVTGAAGFIGFHISKRLLKEGWRVIGLDCMSDYYDVKLKFKRESILLKNLNYYPIHEKVETPNVLMQIFKKENPDIVIHLAAQAGVRYSIENPRAYLESNIVGTFELLEAARAYPPKHMLFASTSSVYGANEQKPYKEIDKADHQMSFYAATKKSTENMAHSYSHLFGLPITMFRFFTVYGPWGRPDMALFKFTKAILNGDKIDLYNHGKMRRDFTYIDDLIDAIQSLINTIPSPDYKVGKYQYTNDNQSPVAQFRIVNIGNSKPESLADFVASIENALEIDSLKNFKDMQAGDVYETYADISLLKSLTNYKPNTDIDVGIKKFVSWYKDYYGHQ